jgi:hypothetical protein
MLWVGKVCVLRYEILTRAVLKLVRWTKWISERRREERASKWTVEWARRNGCKHMDLREWSFIFSCAIKGWRGILRLWFSGVNTLQDIPLMGWEKQGWWLNGKERFERGGMELTVLALRQVEGWKAKGERNGTEGWPERNGMNGSTLAWVLRLVADNERNGMEGGETECSPGV